jgi:hypothetical protein
VAKFWHRRRPTTTETTAAAAAATTTTNRSLMMIDFDSSSFRRRRRALLLFKSRFSASRLLGFSTDARDATRAVGRGGGGGGGGARSKISDALIICGPLKKMLLFWGVIIKKQKSRSIFFGERVSVCVCLEDVFRSSTPKVIGRSKMISHSPDKR